MNHQIDTYPQDFETSKKLSQRQAELFLAGSHRKAYDLYLTDPLGTKADYDTWFSVMEKRHAN